MAAGWAAVEAAQQAWRESNPWHDLYLMSIRVEVVEVEQEFVGVGRSDAHRLACLGWEVVDVEGDGSVLSPDPFSVVFD
jgi:hypothetical protein